MDTYAGLLRPNDYLIVLFRKLGKVLPLRILSDNNQRYTRFVYGSLPVSCNIGGTIYDGVICANALETYSFEYPLLTTTYKDLFFVDREHTIIHAYLTIMPYVLRNMVQMPPGRTAYALKENVEQRPDRDFGWWSGTAEIVFLPRFEARFQTYNPTNLNLYTYAEALYKEYIVEPVKDPEIIYSLLTRKIPAKWYNFDNPGDTTHVINNSLKLLGIGSGIDGLIPLIPVGFRKEEALAMFREVVSTW